MIKQQGSSRPRARRPESSGAAHGRKRASPEGQHARVTVSATYWRPWDDLDVTEWILLGRRLGTIGRGVAWWIGDWVNYGNAQFGQKYSRAARITGYDIQSLMNMSYVASRFDSSRRRENLSWSHHAELAGLAAGDQEMWLENAGQKHLSVRGLREAVRTWRAKQPRDASNASQPQPAAGHPGNDPATTPGDGEVVCPQCGYNMGTEGSRG